MGKFAGAIVVNKEKGYTSHDVVAILRRLLNEKAGHTGTLDPNATGVLPVCFGKATKFSEHFMSENKSYAAEVILGVATTTGDVTGDILLENGSSQRAIYSSHLRFENTDASRARSGSAHGINGENPLVRELSLRQNLNLSRQDIEKTVDAFKGVYMQTPPMYSAIKMGGKKLYEMARSGQTIERRLRPVGIFDIKIVDFFGNSFIINVDCSKGTYIRSLCTDIGEKLGAGATMGELKRTRSGKFTLDGAFTIGQIRESENKWGLVTPIERLLPYPFAELKPAGLGGAKNGNPVKLGNLSHIDAKSPKHWLQAEGKTIGLFSLKNDSLVCEVML